MADIHQHSVIPNCFAEHINSAYRVLQHSYKVIPKLFPGKEVCVMDYISGKQNEKAIEIRFETATLSCLFDENDICDSSFLFLDDFNDLQHYVDYCNKTYIYDYIRRGWIIENHCLEIRGQKEEAIFFLR